MTDKEKANAYDEALERAKKVHKYSSDIAEIKRMEEIFPVLKESEDEEIRKWIIDDIRYNMNNEPLNNSEYKKEAEKAIAWLEKQGQKPADKVETKFHEGDWIVFNGLTLYVKEVVNYTKQVVKGYYRTIAVDGIPNSYDWDIDNAARLWTIQDAKDGDVLIDKSHVGECVFIFKEARPSDIKTEVNNPLAIIGYCGINHIGFTSQLSGLGFGDTANCTYYPATKEQRDLLFRKMQEAGYTFDFKKKELKKLKFKVGDEIITENEESLTITRIDEKGYWSNDLFICDFDSECVWDLVEQKPAEWKQENVEELSGFENAMMHVGGSFFGENAGLDPNDTDIIKEQAELLLELAPKTEWSEEDESMYTRTLGILGKCYMGQLPTKVEEELKWLKSIKQRHTWKPSDDQMKALADALSLAKNCGEERAFDLRTLYEQLKKLKGE